MIARLRRQLRMTLREHLQGATFSNGMSQRLLAIHMLAGLQRRLANRDMPMIRRGDDHGIDSGLFIEQLAVIVIRLGIGQSLHLQSTLTLPLIDIANGNDLLIDLAEFWDQVAPHLAPHPNARKRQSLVGRWACQDSRWQDRGQANADRSSRLNKSTTGDVVGHDEVCFLSR